MTPGLTPRIKAAINRGDQITIMREGNLHGIQIRSGRHRHLVAADSIVCAKLAMESSLADIEHPKAVQS